MDAVITSVRRQLLLGSDEIGSAGVIEKGYRHEFGSLLRVLRLDRYDKIEYTFPSDETECDLALHQTRENKPYPAAAR